MSDQASTVFRVVKSSNFATISNDAIRDERLSYRATGLLCVLLSLPQDWKISSDRLVTMKNGEGRDAVRTALGELKACGYAVLSKSRGARGTMQSVWTIYEQPRTSTNNGEHQPEPENPAPVQPASVNQAPKKRNSTKKEAAGADLFPVDSIKSNSGNPSEVPLPVVLQTPDFSEAWANWYLYRRMAKLKAYTPIGAEKQLKRLALWGAERAIAAIEYSMAQSSQGIFEEKKPRNANQQTPPASASNSGTSNASLASKY